jgi:hypothetical protein
MDIPESQPQTPEGISAPPPPQEVKIRTMRSDLASMAQSGGGLPQFQNVRIDAPAAEEDRVGTPQGERRINIGIAIAIVAVIVVLAIIGYFVFIKK